MALNITCAAPSVVPYGSKMTITENGQFDVTDYAVAEVNVSGGGGSSDFSTAEVTTSADSSDVKYFDLSAVITEEGPDMITIRATSLNPGGTETAVLYKGHQYIYIDSKMYNVTVVSGNAEILTVQDPTYGETKYLDISGDCTITIS